MKYSHSSGKINVVTSGNDGNMNKFIFAGTKRKRKVKKKGK